MRTAARCLAQLLLVIHLLVGPAAAPTTFTARWERAGAAAVQWEQTSRSCLYRQPLIGPAVFLDCYDATGSYAISFGVVGSLDAAYRPQPGDVYVLISGDTVVRAPLRGVTFLPVSRS
jgi:hypothetical protein